MKMYRLKPIHLHKGAPVKMYRLNLYIFTEVDSVAFKEIDTFSKDFN